METLLMVAVIVTALAIVVQAGILIGMYLRSRRLSEKAEALMSDSRRLMAPLESITNNLASLSNDLVGTGKIARDQAVQIQEFAAETRDTIRGQIVEVREIVLDTIDEARDTVMQPLRQYSAISSAIAAGVRTFFGGRKETEPPIRAEERQHPAA